MLHHLQYLRQGSVPSFETGGLFGWFEASGWSLVDLFFVLSGYVFAHVYGAPGLLRQSGAMGDFWVARLARLWPLHGLTLGIMGLMAWGGVNNGGTLLLHLVMAQGLTAQGAASFNLVSWSLSVEMLAYALFALGAWGSERLLLWITVLAVTGCAWWLGMMGRPGGPWMEEIVPRGILGFFAGQVLWRARGPVARCPWPVLAAALAGGLWLRQGGGSPLLPMALLGWPAAVALSLRLRCFEGPAMDWLGQRSFGIYMVHLPLLCLFNRLSGAGMPPLAEQGLFLATALLWADLAYRFVEMPARRLIRAGWAARQRPVETAYA